MQPLNLDDPTPVFKATEKPLFRHQTLDLWPFGAKTKRHYRWARFAMDYYMVTHSGLGLQALKTRPRADARRKWWKVVTEVTPTHQVSILWFTLALKSHLEARKTNRT